MAVEPERADDEPVEVAGQEVGQVERPGLLGGELLEGLAAGVELVAVGAGQALDALLGDDRIEQAARAAVGIGDEDAVIAGCAAGGCGRARRPGCRPAGCAAWPAGR